MKRIVAPLTISVLSLAHGAFLEASGADVSPDLVASVAVAPQPQALNPPYLSEIPPVDRVMSVMRVADPRETALRQIGAFYQLIEIIKCFLI